MNVMVLWEILKTDIWAWIGYLLIRWVMGVHGLLGASLLIGAFSGRSGNRDSDITFFSQQSLTFLLLFSNDEAC